MSLLEDAREILKYGPGELFQDDVPCTYCCFMPHQEECVWLSMPKIVAALEAAEAILNAADDAAYPNWSPSIPGPVVKALYDLEIALGEEAP